VKLLSPVLSFMTEEAYQLYSKTRAGHGSEKKTGPALSSSLPSLLSVHLESLKECSGASDEFTWASVGRRLEGFEDVATKEPGTRMKETWDNLMKVRQEVNASVEEKRGQNFKDSFQTELKLALWDSPEGKF
jgi:isoleucyl-tRNA synthetase